MKTLLVILLALVSVNFASSQSRKLNIVVIGAHPDDDEITSGGTAIKFAKLGHNVLFVSMTNGDAGHYAMGGGILAKVRTAEALEAAKRYGVSSKVLDNHDEELMNSLKIRHDLIRIIREWNADVVIGHRPWDYHPDHRTAGILVQDCSVLVIVPNVVPDVKPLKVNPVFLNTQDNFKKPIPFHPDIAIDISDVYTQKVYGLVAHKSQVFEWLPWIEGKLDEVPKDENKRMEYITNKRKKPITSDVRECLAKWYGQEKADKATDAEAFEINEYGRIPTEEEIKQLFPMLGK
jgi:LmbE family N-acetylglucosaminyl deacetylase